MNATTHLPHVAPRTPVAVPSRAEIPAPRRHRERDFGVGYGNSSGYASDRRYTPAAGTARFRFA